MCLAATELCIGLKLTDICVLAGQKKLRNVYWAFLAMVRGHQLG